MVSFLLAFTRFTVVLFALIFLISCGGNKQKQEALIGNWTILEAQRNGRTTQTLENVFFQFSGDSIMKTNLFGKEDSFYYDYDHPQILPKGSQLGSISVISVVEDTLQLRTSIDKYKFDLELIRSKP